MTDSKSSLLFAFPDAEEAINGLARAVLRGPSSLDPAERELIAAFVSMRNGCGFCATVHAATARRLFGDRASIVDAALANPESLEPRFRALLAIAERIRANRSLDADTVAAALAAGADDRAVHDAVFVAAAFSMINRYVDGFGSAPADAALCDELADHFAADVATDFVCDAPIVVDSHSI
ncbi:MAG: carboxymuconolactone decarboxylase family protein [Gemmataceae bacterium]|nr:carboxymuconolactone decarboxylase family protein [Gemmataceae bacterium]